MRRHGSADYIPRRTHPNPERRLTEPARDHADGDAEALRRRNHELEILAAIAGALNASVEVEASLGAALSRVADLLGLETGWVWLLDESGEPYLAASQNLPPGLSDPRRMEGRCYCLDTFLAGDFTGAANINVITCSRLKWLTEGTAGLRYHASVPLFAHGRRLGVLNVASAQWRRLEAEELRLLHAVGDLLGIAVERARLHARAAAAGATDERNRLAREIHDTLAQSLSAVALRLDAADALLVDADASRVRDLVTAALEITRVSLDEARRTVLDLRAAPLEGRDLAGALELLVATHRTDAGPRIDLECVGGTHPLPPRMETGLYRIAEEALRNALQHAAAGRIRVSLVIAPDTVTLSIADDGAGMAGAPDRRRFGIVGMNERARLLGGVLRVEAAPGSGTRVEVEVPLS